MKLLSWTRTHPIRAALVGVAFILTTILIVALLQSTSIVRLGSTRDLCWSPDGTRLAVAYASGDTVIATFTGGLPATIVQPLETRHKSSSMHCFLAWSPDGRRLAAQYGDFIIVWDTATLKEEARLSVPAAGQWSRLPRLAWSPNSKCLAVSIYNNVIFWDGTIAGTTSVRRLYLDNSHLDTSDHLTAAFTRGVWWSPDGTMLAVPHLNTWSHEDPGNVIAVHRADTGKVVASIPFPSSDLAFLTLLWSPDSRNIAVTSSTPLTSRAGALWLWKIPQDLAASPTETALSPQRLPLMPQTTAYPSYINSPGSFPLAWTPDSRCIRVAQIVAASPTRSFAIHTLGWTVPELQPVTRQTQIRSTTLASIPWTSITLGSQSSFLYRWSPRADKLAIASDNVVISTSRTYWQILSVITIYPQPALVESRPALSWLSRM